LTRRYFIPCIFTYFSTSSVLRISMFLFFIGVASPVSNLFKFSFKRPTYWRKCMHITQRRRSFRSVIYAYYATRSVGAVWRWRWRLALALAQFSVGRISRIKSLRGSRSCFLVGWTGKLFWRTFHFDTRIHPEVSGFINLFSICACSPARFGTIRAKWKTGFTGNSRSGTALRSVVSGKNSGLH
jgi:hypothetical protein